MRNYNKNCCVISTYKSRRTNCSPTEYKQTTQVVLANTRSLPFASTLLPGLAGAAALLSQAPASLRLSNNGIGAAAACGARGGGSGRGGGSWDGGGAGAVRRAGRGAGARGRDQPGVHGRGAEHVGLPDVRGEREHGAAARRAVLPGAGGAAGLQPRLPLRAARRRRQHVPDRRRLQARSRAPRHLPPQHAARQRLRSFWSPCAHGAFCRALDRASPFN